MSENSFKTSCQALLGYSGSEEALLADSLDLIVHDVVSAMLSYCCFLFSVGAVYQRYLFNGLACFDHFQKRHESTFFAQVYKHRTETIRHMLWHSLETWKV
jgi:hypothetical protein